MYLLEKLGRNVLDRPETDDEYAAVYGFNGGHLAVLTISGALVGARLTGGNVLLAIFHLPYAVCFYLVNIIFFYTLIGRSPYYIAALIALLERHPATSIVKASAGRKRPDRGVERELAVVFNSQTFEDRQVQALFEELSPWKKWYWQVRGNHARR